jgi:hypothetical protein
MTVQVTKPFTKHIALSKDLNTSLDVRSAPLTRYNAEDIEKLADRFAAEIPDQVYSVTMLQGFLMNHRQNPAVAVPAFEEWNEKHQGVASNRASNKENTVSYEVNTINKTKVET